MQANPALEHRALEDILALVIGTALIVVGLYFLHEARLTTGGLAGVALLLSYITPFRPGQLFLLLNIPFLYFAWRTMGPEFLFKTIITIVAIPLTLPFMPHLLPLGGIDAPFAALFGGAIVGMGILALARHRGSVGGIGVLALWLQESRGWRAGHVQMATDVLIVAAAAFVLDWQRLLLSVMSAVALGLVLTLNHRPGRYAGH